MCIFVALMTSAAICFLLGRRCFKTAVAKVTTLLNRSPNLKPKPKPKPKPNPHPKALEEPNFRYFRACDRLMANGQGIEMTFVLEPPSPGSS